MLMKQQEFKCISRGRVPLRTIVENAGLEGSVVVAKLKVQVIWIQCQKTSIYAACSRY
jgi:chaperonin GroEL (HSP60 family)